jgi:inosose dehydratase
MGEDWMKVTIGTAPDSWGVWFADDPRQMPWQRFLDEVAEAGYKWIELGPYGYLPTDLSVLRSELTKRDLKVSGSFIAGDLASEAGWPKLEHALATAARRCLRTSRSSPLAR